MRPNQKLYVVTRRDLPPGSQAVQGMHALVEFIMYWPQLSHEWYKDSNHLCFLSVANEAELNRLVGMAARVDVAYTTFREPDLSMSLTAVVLEATDKAGALVSDLTLALR